MPARSIRSVSIDTLQLDKKNARKHGEIDIAAIAESLKTFGQQTPIVIDKNKVVIKGNGTLMAAMKLGWEKIDVIQTDLTGDQLRAYAIADNKTALLSDWDTEALIEQLKQLETSNLAKSVGFSDAELLALLGTPDPESVTAAVEDAAAKAENEAKVKKLSERFGVVPFSVLNAREGWWQERKQAWIATGIRSELGRGENLLQFSETAQLKRKPYETPKGSLTFGIKVDAYKNRGERPPELNGLLMKSWTSHPEFYPQKTRVEKEIGRELTTAEFIENYFVPPEDDAYTSGTSIFDPVLCELAYRWFCPQRGVVLDPFAGGSVRGIVAGRLGRRYYGGELRGEQVEANRQQAEGMPEAIRPVWATGDSRNIDLAFPGLEADFVFSCPPYYDLEVYSDDPQDISNVPWDEFLEAYRLIVAKSCAMLRDNRFACFVVGEVRGDTGGGAYRNLVGETVRAFMDAGMSFYNEAILVTAVGSLPIRVGAQFAGSRKLGKTHQNVLVFCKGDPKLATEAVGEVEFGDIPSDATADAESVASEFGEVLP